MADFPALPLFTDAYLADTVHLTTEEHGAYMLLLMTAWRTPDCKLPDDDSFLSRVARCSPRVWARLRPVMAQFWIIEDGWWSQKRLRKERDYVEEVRATRSKLGREGGRKSAATRAANALQRNKTAEAHAEAEVPVSFKLTPSKVQAPTPTPIQESNTPLSAPPLDIEPDTVSTSPNGSVRKRKAVDARGTRLPEQWHPGDDGLRFAAGLGLTPNEASTEADKFRDYWRGRPGEKGRKSDWPATWRNWCRKAADNKQASRPREPASIMQSYRNVSGRASAADPWDLEDDEPSERRALSSLPFGVTFGRA